MKNKMTMMKKKRFLCLIRIMKNRRKKRRAKKIEMQFRNKKKYNKERKWTKRGKN